MVSFKFLGVYPLSYAQSPMLTFSNTATVQYEPKTVNRKQLCQTIIFQILMQIARQRAIRSMRSLK